MKRKAISCQKQIVFWAMILNLIFIHSVQALESDLVISEIMYDFPGADSGHEWIEIYNSGSENVVASSTWKFFDGSNHNLNLYQGTSTIASEEFFVLADKADQFLLDYPNYSGILFDTVMSLPNSSADLALIFLNSSSTKVFYDSVWGADGNGASLEKIILNHSTSSDNWQESSQNLGTPGQVNSEGMVYEPPIEEPIVVNPQEQYWPQIIISEFLPNPVGSDDNEWIELYNLGPEIINLVDFSLGDNSSRRFTLDEDSSLNLLIGAGQYLVLNKDITGISLNNSKGDSVKLYNPNEVLQESVIYSETALEGRSYAKGDSGFVWTKSPSPGASNQIIVNQAPRAQIIIKEGQFLVKEKITFSAQYSSDPENDELDYVWDFGDTKVSTKETIKHAYDQIGVYTVSLKVIDEEGLSNQVEMIINIEAKVDSKEEDLELITDELNDIKKLKPINFSEDDLIISEFLPNPVGSDDNEWIELYNASSQSIDLLFWYLDDNEGGSKPYQFSTTTIIMPDSFLLVNRSDSKITLNNSSDAVRLLTPEGELWQEVVYEKIPEGKSQAWDFVNSEWFVAATSPGTINLAMNEPIVVYSVAEVKDLAKNDEILVQGVILNNIDSNSRSVYLADWGFKQINFEELIEIYSYYKNFPELKAGDVVTVNGQISKVGDLPRLKIKTAEQIWSNDQSVDLIWPEAIDLDNLDQDLLGSLLSVKGIVVKKSGKSIYLANDPEEDYSLRVYSRFSTKDLDIKKGNEILVSGILSETDSGFKLTPFSIGDILVSKQISDKKIESNQGDDLKISSSTNQIVGDSRKNNIKTILVFLLIGSFIVGVVYFVNKRNKLKGSYQ